VVSVNSMPGCPACPFGGRPSGSGKLYPDAAPGGLQPVRERTNRSSLMLASVGVPAWRMIAASSWFRISITASTPGWPNAASPHAWGLPIPTAVAPSASALEDIRTATDPTVDKHGCAAVYRRDNFG